MQAPIKEKVTVGTQKGSAFTLHWTTAGLDNPSESMSTTGDVEFQETSAGLINTNWSSTPPPPDLPVLCPTLACNNTLSSMYDYSGRHWWLRLKTTF